MGNHRMCAENLSMILDRPSQCVNFRKNSAFIAHNLDILTQGFLDNLDPMEVYDFLAQLNIDANDMARAHQETIGQARPYGLMTKHLSRRNRNSKVLTGYSTSHKKYSLEKIYFYRTMEKINWNAHGKAMPKHKKQRNQI
jgi:hypothetical protein